jgi:hypothetical protein
MSVMDHVPSFPIFLKDCNCRKRPPIDELHGASRDCRFGWLVVPAAYVSALIFPSNSFERLGLVSGAGKIRNAAGITKWPHVGGMGVGGAPEGADG